MLKSIRKYNKAIMVVFGSVLMLAFLAPQTIQQFGSQGAGTIVAKIDGRGVRADDMARALREVSALDRAFPFLTQGVFGIADRDVHHWLLLVHEATAAGLVGGPEDGVTFVDDLAREAINQELRTNPALIQQLTQSGDIRGTMDRLAQRGVEIATGVMVEQGLRTPAEVNGALARARGVLRLLESYGTANAYSDRRAILAALRARDGVLVDLVTLDAGPIGAAAPEPTPEQLRAHFDRFKATRPGAGAFGIGFLLPPRVKFEYLELSRADFEKAVTLDPVEVAKRHRARKDRYTGEFAADRPRVEADMRAEVVDAAMLDAQREIQAEVLKVTRRLDADGRHRRLPPDWEQTRPRWQAIAEGVARSAKTKNNLTIPTPRVVTVADRWLTQADLPTLPGIGQSVLRQGSIQESFVDVAFWTRELGGATGVIPVQVGLPLADSYFTDGAGNRYYITVLAVRPESAPDSFEEIRDQVVASYRTLSAYESLKARAEELRALAAASGLEAAVAAVPGAGNPQMIRNGIIRREEPAGGQPLIEDPAQREQVLAAGAGLDALAAPNSIAADKATLALPSDARMALTLARIVRRAPLSLEDYKKAEGAIVFRARQEELRAAQGDVLPFSFAQMLKRHNYESNEVRMESPEAFRRQSTGPAEPAKN